MGSIRTFQQSFAGGEMSPKMGARLTDVRYQNGAKTLRNMVLDPTGMARRRPGTQFVALTKSAANRARVLPFEFSDDDALAIEFGAGYFRFHYNGAPVLLGATPAAWLTATAYTVGNLVSNGGVNYYCYVAHTSGASTQPGVGASWATVWHALSGTTYEIPNTYAVADLDQVRFFQSLDVVTLLHQSHPPRELRRYGATDWRLQNITFGAGISPPTGLFHTATNGLNFTITNITHGGSRSTLTTVTDHGFANGDPLYVQDIAGVLDIDDGPYIAANASGTTLSLLQVDGGANVLGTGTYTANSGTVRFSSLTADPTDTYVVTSVDENGQESEASAERVVTNNLTTPGSKNVLGWVPATGAVRYRVYKQQNGLFGFIGETDDNEFTDDNIAPDMGSTPPIEDNSLSGSDYPQAGCYFEQRRTFAGTAAAPQSIWMTVSGSESNLNYSIPTRATDRISLRIDGRRLSSIMHMVPMGHLIALTRSGTFRVTPVNSDSLTPATVTVRAQNNVGSSYVQPLVVGSHILFVDARGNHLRDIPITATVVDGMEPADLSVRASHLVADRETRSMDVQIAPVPIVWQVQVDGEVNAMTFIPEQEVAAWSRIDTDGLIESVAVVTEGGEDRVYLEVARTFNGVTTRYIERTAPLEQDQDTLADSWFVDCGQVYDSTPTTNISGATHLNGRTVAVLADGVATTRVISGGAFTKPLTTAASRIVWGIPFESEIVTLPAPMQIEGFGTGRPKNVDKVWARVVNSARFQVGAENGSDLAYARNDALDWSGLVTGEVECVVPGGWHRDGAVRIRQTDPVPLNVAGITIEYTIGG